MTTLYTPRLQLEPVTLPIVEAVMAGDRRRAEAAGNVRLPEAWPGKALIERAFTASLEAIRADPDTRLWGDRLLVARDGSRCVLGSVVFHGRPGPDGIAEIGYGVEQGSQGMGIATEACQACVAWAFEQPGVLAVRATTFPWHRASLRVIEKLGMYRAAVREHDLFGELWIFEVRR